VDTGIRDIAHQPILSGTSQEDNKDNKWLEVHS
jgi:hypothetical protein